MDFKKEILDYISAPGYEPKDVDRIFSILGYDGGIKGQAQSALDELLASVDELFASESFNLLTCLLANSSTLFATPNPTHIAHWSMPRLKLAVPSIGSIIQVYCSGCEVVRL